MLAVAVVILDISLKDTGNAGNKDFVSYWAAAKRLLHRSNPYDPGAILSIEKSAGFRPAEPLFMRNPPYALSLTILLGLLPVNAAAVLWSLLLVASTLISIRLVWKLHGSPADSLHLLGYMFAPVLACMMLGQTSVLALAGVCLFLRLQEKIPAAAGAALCLLAIKPHLFIPFGIVIVVNSICRKNYRVLLTFIAAALVLGAIPVAFRSDVWTEYGDVFRAAGRESQAMPTISSITRLTIGHGATWTQFLPAAIGSIWAIEYFRRNRRHWRWVQHAPLLLLVSLLVAPYSWFTDDVIVLPAILGLLLSSRTTNRSLVAWGVLNGIALVAVLIGVPVGSGFYVWTPVAWLVWYTIARRSELGSAAPPQGLVDPGFHSVIHSPV